MLVNKPMVLILCTGNSCRSQMAEGFLTKSHGDRFEVRSAGTLPAERVHTLAVKVMAEVGIDISMQRPKGIRQFLGHDPVRHILIVCNKASDTCPRIWPGVVSRTVLPFDDPAAFEGTEDEKLGRFRSVRNEIELALRGWTPEQKKHQAGTD